jgi:hypothetical protein
MPSRTATSKKHGNERHGQAKRGAKTPTYLAWESMIRRCTMPSQDSYRLYGARGITICERWRDFAAFLADMGEKPENLSLDRIDSAGNYEPGNCRWASKEQQSQNRRTAHMLTYGGETMALSAWAHRVGLAPRTLRERIVTYGWSLERALTTAPVPREESIASAGRARHNLRHSRSVTD